jgi:trans-2,3-dihydro-3-hydroxyanthranilate isomerase
MQPEFLTLDVFTDRLYGGNPLAVFPDARGLTTDEMQRIAREFNLSETVFVLPPRDPANSRQLRIFTPANELPFAGHPTIGAAHALAALGHLDTCAYAATEFRFEEGVGVIPVTLRMAQSHPVYAELRVAQLPVERAAPASGAAIAAMLGLEPGALAPGEAPSMLSCGLPFLFVEVRDRAALGRTRLDPVQWQALLAGAWAREVFVYCRDGDPRVGHARMFAPGLGVSEDPATGSAVAALAGRLARLEPARDDTQHWRIHQGQDMGRPSLIELRFTTRAGALTRVSVGGNAVLVSRGRLLRPLDVRASDI